MRLDKFLCGCGLGTRSRIKKDIRDGLVTVDGAKALRPEQQIDEARSRVCYGGKPCVYERHVYYLLNKPAGVVSATEDARERTVLDLLGEDRREGIFPVGRLDKDAEGLLLLTDDGALAHALTSPAKHVEKEYECRLAAPIDARQKELLEQGVDIGEKNPTRPAAVRVLDERRIALTITEGRFHQVKRMLRAVGNEVVFLKRLRMGPLRLDGDLAAGSYRKLTEEETERLRND